MTGFLIFLTWCIYCSISRTYFLGCITTMYQSTWWLVTSVQTWSWKAGNIYNRKATLCTELQVHISIYYMSGFALICHVLCSIHFVVVHSYFNVVHEVRCIKPPNFNSSLKLHRIAILKIVRRSEFGLGKCSSRLFIFCQVIEKYLQECVPPVSAFVLVSCLLYQLKRCHRNCFGLSIAFGLTTALDSLVSQAHGAQQHQLCGETQRPARAEIAEKLKLEARRAGWE